MEEHEEIQQAFSRVPVNRHLGLRLVSRSAETAVVEMSVHQDQVQEGGVVHGGLLSALADTAAVYVFYPSLPEGQSMASIEFKMNFLRPARVDRGPLVARSMVLRRGTKVGVCEVEVTQDNLAIAKGLFTYLFMETTAWNDESGN